MDQVAEAPPAARRLSLVHDYLLVMRGAERTFAAMAELYGESPIFTLLYNEQATAGRFAGRSISTSPLQHLGVSQSSFRRLLPLYPYAIERLKLAPSEVVLSSSSAFAHGVHVPEHAIHICYCHTPFRYAWYAQQRALDEISRPLRPLLRWQLQRMRRWDVAASRRVNCYIANSSVTRERIKHYYGRESTVIYPPVETHRFTPSEPGDSLLLVTELVAHKRVHVALEAARRSRVPIRVAGSGPEHAALSEAFPEADFLGRVDDRELAGLYAAARAVLVPSVEEFGITAVEAQAAGRPVIAAAAGGALETVIDGKTGILAAPDDVESFAQAIAAIDRLDFEPSAAVRNAERFSVAAFKQQISAYVEHALASRR